MLFFLRHFYSRTLVKVFATHCRRYYSSTFPIKYSLTAYHIPFLFAGTILFGLRRKQGRFSKMSDGLGIAAAKHHRSSTLAPLLSPVRYCQRDNGPVSDLRHLAIKMVSVGGRLHELCAEANEAPRYDETGGLS
jgi:hypothetical protein